MHATWKTAAVALAVAAVGGAAAHRPPEAPAAAATSPAAQRAEIEAMKPAKVAWREIAWKRCLIEGLKEAREKQKPVLLWVFIDRPADDARC